MARAFAFRLEQVLNYRRQLEEAAIRRMAAAEAALLRIREEQARRRGQKEELADWFSGEERRGSFLVEEAAGYTDYLDFLSGLEKGLRGKEAKALAELGKCRDEVVRAAQKRRALEGLKERRYAAYQAEVAKEEQAFLDDISSIAFVRRERASRARRALEA